MQNINQDDAFSMVTAFINTLAGNLLIPVEVDEYSTVSPKEKWINPLIEELVESLQNLDCFFPITFIPVPDTLAVHADHDRVSWDLEDLIKDIGEDLEYHENIRGSDDQYEDPQEWWLRPLVSKLKEAHSNITFNVY